MGLFNKKLDYSSGNGVLPRVDSSDYSTLSLPNTSLMRMPNMNLMVKERDQGNLEKAFGASVDAFFATENEAACRVTIEKYLTALRARMAPNLGEEATQLLAKFIGIGCGMAIVESKSGLMLAGKRTSAPARLLRADHLRTGASFACSGRSSRAFCAKR